MDQESRQEVLLDKAPPSGCDDVAALGGKAGCVEFRHRAVTDGGECSGKQNEERLESNERKKA